ncbi:Chloroplast sensor kinase [Nymphaea thermarum]|nr:Chloroplast sensor kinase [Nymphaea thermarum]
MRLSTGRQHPPTCPATDTALPLWSGEAHNFPSRLPPWTLACLRRLWLSFLLPAVILLQQELVGGRPGGASMAILTVLPSSALRPSKGAPEAFLSKGGVPVRTAACSLRAGSGCPAKGPATRLTPCLSGPGEPSPMPPGEPGLISSATAAASVILRASPSPVEFVQRIEKARDKRVALPSPEFQRLCHEQLDLFRRLVHEDAILSVYVRPAGSYVMDRLELWRVTLHTRMKMSEESDIVVLIGKFCLPAGLRSVEAAMAVQLIEDVPECRALVLPMVKDPFLVGFLVAELPSLDAGQYMEQRSDDPIVHVEAAENKADNCLDKLEFHPLKKLRRNYFSITSEQKSGAVNISRSLAVAYVMDQKTLLLQHSSWQNNIRISNLVEQIRGSLSSVRALSKMLSIHLKKDEVC